MTPRRKPRWHEVAPPPRGQLCAWLGRDLTRAVRIASAEDGLTAEAWLRAVVRRALRIRAYLHKKRLDFGGDAAD